jgi:hypothetical protein
MARSAESDVHKPKAEVLEGIAFQFCKVATVALLAGRYTLPVASGLCALFYLWAFASGQRSTRCILRYPLLLAAVWGAVCIVAVVLIARPGTVKLPF